MMKGHTSTLIPILAVSLLIAGCKTLPVVPHAMSCDVNAEILAGKCSAPRQISSGSSYAELVDTMQEDRKSLRECSITADMLRDTLKRCSQATENFNKVIDTLNSKQ
jgi:hypothetical protein